MENQEHVDSATLTMLQEILEDGFAGLLQTFISDTAERLVQLQSALESQDCDSVRRGAHSIKGSASNLGAHKLAGFASELEAKGRDEDLSGTENLLDNIRSEYQEVEVIMQGILKDIE
ncbi:hypothetical protein NBRC116493_19540 [Aurantivibrio infirmus]